MIISTFKSISKAYVDLQLDLEWNEVAELLMSHYDADNKHDVELYNMVEFKDPNDPTTEPARRYHYIDGVKQETYDVIPNTVRRCKGNVVSITGIVLDIDSDKTIEQAIELLDGIEYVLYTTFRHTMEKHKFRVVIPFSKPLLREDIAGRQQDIINTFPGVDNASFTVSQSFYFHSGKNDCITYHNRGVMINPYDFKYTEPNVYVPIETEYVVMDDEVMERYRENVRASLLSCSGLHYAGYGDKTNAVLTLISICRSAGITFSEYDSICNQIAAADSELKKAVVRHNAWVGWKGDRIRKEVRDKFIKDYGGRPLPKKIDKIVEYGERLNEIKLLSEILKRKKNGTK